MSTSDEVNIRLRGDGSIFVEEYKDGVKSFKAITPDSLLGCINASLSFGRVGSGLLPKNCLSFTADSDGSKDICILHPEDKADITFLNAEYKDFPLPRLVFGFKVSNEGLISSCRLGVIEDSSMIKPETKMYRWPLSNVRGTHICVGNNPLPKCKSTSTYTLSSLPYLIIGIPNNLDHFSAVNNRMGLEMRELLELLKDKHQSYYYEHILVPSETTLASFIS